MPLIGSADSLAGGRVYARLDDASYAPRFGVPNAVIAADDIREYGGTLLERRVSAGRQTPSTGSKAA